MSKPKHTRGPWLIRPGNKAPLICVDGDKDWPIVTQVCGPDSKQINANAHLIAAAPELLEALEMVSTDALQGFTYKGIEVVPVIKAAIKKARGE